MLRKFSMLLVTFAIVAPLVGCEAKVEPKDEPDLKVDVDKDDGKVEIDVDKK